MLNAPVAAQEACPDLLLSAACSDAASCSDAAAKGAEGSFPGGSAAAEAGGRRESLGRAAARPAAEEGAGEAKRRGGWLPRSPFPVPTAWECTVRGRASPMYWARFVKRQAAGTAALPREAQGILL